MEIGRTVRLLKATMKGMKNAYVFRVFSLGVAVLGEGGEIYEECNVESAVSGLGTCADRRAIDRVLLRVLIGEPLQSVVNLKNEQNIS